MSNRNTILIAAAAAIVLGAAFWFGYLHSRLGEGGAPQRALKPGEVLFSSQPAIVGRTIVRQIDWRCQFFFYDASDRFTPMAQQAIALLREAASKAGANGVVGVTFAQVGSQVRAASGPVSQVALCGDLVEFR